MFFGVVFWGRYVEDWSKKSTEIYKYPFSGFFSGLESLNRNNYDIRINSLNCPITDNNILSSQ